MKILRKQQFAFAILLAATACNKPSPSSAERQVPTNGQLVPRYELICDSSDTKSKSSLFCMRHDTQTGDVKRVAIDHIPVSQGSTGTTRGPNGSYSLVCHATRTENTSNLYCVRINTQTGEMLIVALPKVGVLPDGASAHTHGGTTHKH